MDSGENRRSPRREARKRDEDIEFLSKLSSASREELLQMRRNHVTAPEWKILAIDRAIHRRGIRA